MPQNYVDVTPTLDLTPDEVRAWLDKLPNDGIAGQRWSMLICPLALYLSQREQRSWTVGAKSAWVTLRAENHSDDAPILDGGRKPQYAYLPQWAQCFVAATDDTGDKLHIFDNGILGTWDVTVTQARRILEKVTAGS